MNIEWKGINNFCRSKQIRIQPIRVELWKKILSVSSRFGSLAKILVVSLLVYVD
jgi:hypothetical protein